MTALLLVVAMTTALVACGDDDDDEAGTTTSAAQLQPLEVRVNQFAGGSGSWLTTIAQAKGFFAKHGIDFKPQTFGGGPQVTNAFLAGSIDIGLISVEQTLAMMAAGQEIDLVVGAGTNIWAIIGGSGTQAGNFPAVIRQLDGKTVAILAPGTPGDYLLRYTARKAGLGSSALSLATGGSVPGTMAAITGGQASGAVVEIIGTCIARSTNLPILFSFMSAAGRAPAGAPNELTTLVDQPQSTFWVRRSWRNDNQEAVKRFQAAIIEAVNFAVDRDNLTEIARILRASEFNVPTLNDQQWASCVELGMSTMASWFSEEDAETWIDVLGELGVLKADAVPPPSRWIVDGVPADADDAREAGR